MKYLKGGLGLPKARTRLIAGLLVGSAGLMPTMASAQDADADSSVANGEENAIVVTGIRSSLQSALNEKRQADSIVEIIQAEDIGKLPDQNLAEVLENVTGVQITRTAGVGTGVQIRGTNDNQVLINGVKTVAAGTGRGGISFEDINPAIIGSVEVIKAPTAATIEGSVGGTVNLRTIRPLDITDTIISARIQGEYSELSESVKPRISGSFGDVWEAGDGEIGLVLSASYTEQDATSFRPRVDRDNLIQGGQAVTAAGAPGPDNPFLNIQFLNQERENFEFDTINFAGSLEYAPNPGLMFFLDVIYNDQERRQDSSRIQGSGVSAVDTVNVPDGFETVNFGSLDGLALGSIEAALFGTIQPNIARDDDDPNLRFSSDTGARLTTSELYRFGTEFETGRFTTRVEFSRSASDTSNPNLSTTLNFINPNPLTPLDGSSNDNSVPFIYDLRDGALTFGVDFASPFAPTVDDLLNPNNTVLDAVTNSNNTTDNSENAFRIDTTLDLDGVFGFITSVDAGYRYSDASSEFNQLRSTFGTGAIANSPSGADLGGLIVQGPDNFGDFDGRELAFRNFVVIDPDRSFSDRDAVFAELQAALDATPGGQARIADGSRLLNDLDPTSASNRSASFRIEETTHALYAQANFETGPVRGNIGFRYVDTSIDSFGVNAIPDIVDDMGNVVTPAQIVDVTANAGYSEFLPRVNLIADVADDVLFRASYTEDINRPDFNDLSLSISLPTGPNNAVALGNPGLAPETVKSYDASLEWYFAPSSLISIGIFHKDRTNLFVTQVEDALEDANGFRELSAPCAGGGIFNPVPDRNVLAPDDQQGNGLCVPLQTIVNDTASTTQTGIEIAFQYDLSQFEDTLGFASGFGLLANYTYQDFGGGEATQTASGRGQDIFEAINPDVPDPVEAVQGLLDFSENAYNITLYYEKYGLSARARYTWRDAFRTLDTAAGASLNSTLGFPVVTSSRAQLNASVVYDVTDNIAIGVEGVNLTKSRISQFCVNEGALLCFQGLPDRRITFGATVRF